MKKLSAIEIKKETRKLIKRIKEAEMFLGLEEELPADIVEMVREINKKKSN
jgi:hypothetical protein